MLPRTCFRTISINLSKNKISSKHRSPSRVTSVWSLTSSSFENRRKRCRLWKKRRKAKETYTELTPKRRGLGNWPSRCRNSMYNFWFPKNLSFSSVFSGDWFQDPSQRILKSPVENGVDRSMHAVGPPHSWTPNRGLKTAQVFTEQNPHISGPTQFEPVLFRSHLELRSQWIYQLAQLCAATLFPLWQWRSLKEFRNQNSWKGEKPMPGRCLIITTSQRKFL